MTKIILICGRKQSGKTTLANAIHGHYLTSLGIIPNANIGADGVVSIVYDKKNKLGITFDISNQEAWFEEWCQKNTWPHIKAFSIAKNLKEAVIGLFGIDRKLVYGSNTDKNSDTYIKWKDVIMFLSEDDRINAPLEEYLTVRELLEVFGTNVCRSIDDDCHIRNTITSIKTHGAEISVIDDGRFDTEFEFVVKEKDVFTIKLTRQAFESSAISEQALPFTDESLYDVVVPPHVSILEKNKMVIDALVNKGWLKSVDIKVIE